MTRRTFLISMFAAAALQAVGTRLPSFVSASVWLRASAASFDKGITWGPASEVPDGTPVSRIFSINTSAFLEQKDPAKMPTFVKEENGCLHFNGSQHMRGNGHGMFTARFTP